jgi:trehalose 6-phosphate synthase/phosphatase
MAAGRLERIRPMLERFVANTPGSHIETKCASIAWHFRRVHPAFGTRRAHELRTQLEDLLRTQSLEILEGASVIEVRLPGISKALVAEHIRAEAGDGFVLAIGDDWTDEDLFRALPPSSATVVVGQRPSCARFRAADYREVRQILEWCVSGWCLRRMDRRRSEASP